MLIAGSVIQQIKQQLQQAAVGWWKQHEQQLKRLNLAFLVRHICLIPLIIEASQFWTQIRELLQKEEGGHFTLSGLYFTLIWIWQGCVVRVNKHLQSSGEHDSVCAWVEALAALPGMLWAMWPHHWGGSRPSLDLSLPQRSAFPSGLPASGCGLAHGTNPPHEGLRDGRERWSETAIEEVKRERVVCRRVDTKWRRCSETKTQKGGERWSEWNGRREAAGAKCFQINYWPRHLLPVSTFSEWHHHCLEINHDLMLIHSSPTKLKNKL